MGFKRISLIKTFLVFLSFGLLSLPLKAQQETILYFDFKEEIWNLEGDPQKDGVFWNLKNRLPEGTGNFKFPDGRLYEGEWQQGWIEVREPQPTFWRQYNGSFKKGVFMEMDPIAGRQETNTTVNTWMVSNMEGAD